MKKQFIFIFLSVICMDTITAQSVKRDTVGIDEMRSIFSSYESGEECEQVKNYDITGGGVFFPVPGLRKAGDIILPPSLYNVIKDDSTSSGDKVVRYLCWEGLSPVVAQGDSAKIKNELVRRYGTITRNGVRYIPARWFSGDITTMCYPYRYMNKVVCKLICVKEYADGVKTKLDNGQYGERYISLIGTLWSKAKELVCPNRLRETNDVDGRIESKEMELLADSVNLYSKDIELVAGSVHRYSSQNVSVKGKKEYTIIVYAGKDGHYCLDVLRPVKLKSVDKMLTAELSVSLSMLQPKSLGAFWTSDGRVLACRYLFATFENGKWLFYDHKKNNIEIKASN